MKTWTLEEIITLLDKNNIFVERCIVKIYERQTEDEQETFSTQNNNGIGFSGADAGKLTYYAKWILAGKHLNGKHLETARQRIKKYKKQILAIANQNIPVAV